MSLREWKIDEDIKSRFFTASSLLTPTHSQYKCFENHDTREACRSSSDFLLKSTRQTLHGRYQSLLAMGGANLAGVTYHVVAGRVYDTHSNPITRALQCGVL
jgi:hypothetical protein